MKAINNLTGSDLRYLCIFSQRSKNDNPEFWDMIERFSVMERLGRKKQVKDIIDLSAITDLDAALTDSLVCEKAFASHKMNRIAHFFRYLTLKLDDAQHVLN